MNKYKNFIIILIFSFLSLVAVINTSNLNSNTIFINSFPCLILFLCFFYIIKNNLFTSFFSNKRLLYTCLIISIIFSFCITIGYNLTLYNQSYLNKISAYLNILMLLPIIMSCSILIFKNLDKIKDFMSNFYIKKINNLLFEKKQITLIICWILIFIAWLPIFLAFFPGIFSYDSSTQIYEYLSHSFTNNNPLLHTMIVGSLLKLGHELFNSYSIGVAIYSLFQMIVLSGTFAYVISYLNKRKAPFILKIIFLCIFMFSPTNSVLSITTTKDVIFTAVITLLFTKLIDMAIEPYTFFKYKKNIILTILLCLLTFTLRHNAYYAFLFFSFFLIIFLRKYWKPILVIVFSSIGIYNLYLLEINNILSANNDSFTKSAIICIPMQQLGRTYNLATNLTSDEKKLLNDLAIDGKGFLNYQPHKSDAIMWSTNIDKIYQNKKEYLKLYIKLGIKNPILYTDAFLANTMGYWYIGDKLPDSTTYRTYIEIRSIDTSKMTKDQIKFDSKIPWLFDKYYNLTEKATYQNIPILSFIMSVPFQILLLFIMTLMIIYKKKYINLLPLVLLYGLLLTLFLGPVALLRYSYPIFTTMPLIIYLALYNSKKAIKD